MIRLAQNQIASALFDLDGTLIDTNIDFARMKQLTLELCNLHGISPDRLQGLDILAAIEYTQSELPSSEAIKFKDRAWILLEQLEWECVASASVLPFASELLEGLKSHGIMVGVVTRNCRSAVDELIKLLPCPPDVLLTRNDVQRVKPDPMHLEMALDALKTDAKNTIMVGDHRMDIQAGLAAGCHTIGILWHHPTNWFDPIIPNHTFLTLEELADALFDSDS